MIYQKTGIIYQIWHVVRPGKRSALHKIQMQNTPNLCPVRICLIQKRKRRWKCRRVWQYADTVEHPFPKTAQNPFGLRCRHAKIIGMKPNPSIHKSFLRSLRIYLKNFIFVVTYRFHSRRGSCISLYSHSRQSICMMRGARLIVPAR